MIPGAMNFGKFGRQFEEIQKKLARLEADLRERVVEATAGGGMVKVKVTGAEEVVDIKVEPEVVNPNDKGMLEDLLLAAVNEGMRKAKKMRETEIARVTGIPLPPGMM